MEYKAYYTFKTTAESDQEINEINFDWVNASGYRFDVHDADGFGWEGKDVDCSGSFTFECETENEETEEYEPCEINWDEFCVDEAVFSLFDEDYEPIDFGNETESYFSMTIYDDKGKKHTDETSSVYPGNIAW